jgi:transposase
MATISPVVPDTDTDDARMIGRKGTRGAVVEIITRGGRRRLWTLEQKREIVAESLSAALTPIEIARKYAISSSLLYIWRQR